MASWTPTQGQWWTPPPAPTPPRRPIGNLVSTSLRVCGRDLAGFLMLSGAVFAIAAIPLVPTYVAYSGILGDVLAKQPSFLHPTQAEIDAYAAAYRAAGPAILGLGALIAVVGGATYPIAIAAAVAATPQAAAGQPVNRRAALGRLRAHLGSVLGLVGVIVALEAIPSLLVQAITSLDPGGAYATAGRLGTTIGLTLLVSVSGVAAFILLLYLYARWFVAFPAMLVEGLGFRAALARSSALTRGSRWYLLGTIILLAILQGLLTIALIFVAAVIALALGAAAAASSTQGLSTLVGRAAGFAGIVGLVVGAVFAPVIAIAMAIVHSDFAWRQQAAAAVAAQWAQAASGVPPTQPPGSSSPPGAPGPTA